LLQVTKTTDKKRVACTNWATNKAALAKVMLLNNPELSLTDLYGKIMHGGHTNMKSDLVHGKSELLPDRITLTYKDTLWYEISDDGRKMIKL